MFLTLSIELGCLQVKVQGQNQEMLAAACQQFLGKSEAQIQNVALETLEGHQRAIMGLMTVEVTTALAVFEHRQTGHLTKPADQVDPRPPLLATLISRFCLLFGIVRLMARQTVAV